METKMTFGEFVKQRFSGVLKRGLHAPDGQACVLEARSQMLNRKWSDAPGDFIDLRPLNDGPWETDEQRTKYLVPVVEALWDWPKWSLERRNAWAKIVAGRIVKEVIPPALRMVGLEAEAARCEREGTAKAARVAARAARAAWAAEAAKAARVAARAARAAGAAWAAAAAGAAEAAKAAAAVEAAAEAAWAAEAAEAAEVEKPLILACSIFIDAAKLSVDQCTCHECGCKRRKLIRNDSPESRAWWSAIEPMGECMGCGHSTALTTCAMCYTDFVVAVRNYLNAAVNQHTTSLTSHGEACLQELRAAYARAAGNIPTNTEG